FVFALFAGILLSLAFSGSVDAAAVSWTAGSGAWETGTNWSSGNAPNSADDVTIDAAVTVTINAGTTINSLTIGTTSAATLTFAYDALDATNDGATPAALILDDGNLTLNSNGTITHSASTTSIVATAYIDVQSGSATIAGTIDLDELGYAQDGGPGKGVVTSGLGGGGGHGGTGGDGYNLTGDGIDTGGDVYGSVAAPIQPGSGGAYDSPAAAGSGGGAIRINISTNLSLTGTITADGGNAVASGRESGGGAGGSVYITVGGTLAGSGSITANGGTGHDNSSNEAGGGGGGRIAITYKTDSSTVTKTAYGGVSGNQDMGDGGAGTIFTHDTDDAYGDLLLDNNDQDISATNFDDRFIGKTPLTATGSSLSITFSDVTIKNAARLDVTSDLTITVDDTLVWTDDGIIYDNGGTFTDDTPAAVSNITGGVNLTVPSGATLYANEDATFSGDVSISGTLTHSNNDTEANGQDFDIVYTVSGDLTIAGSVDVDSRGYEFDEGPGAGSLVSGLGGGGGHGGEGADAMSYTAGGLTSAGSIYGSIIAPVTIGSGGGYDTPTQAGAGGGASRFTVTGTTNLTGSITADGEDASSGGRENGGGSGGSVYISTGILSGNGSITADGGDGYDNSLQEAGSGGGGRISLVYTTDSSTITETAYGGAAGSHGLNHGGAGTIYLKDNDDTYGDLVIKNNDQDLPTSNYDDRFMGRTPLTPSGTPLTLTLSDLTIQDDGNLDLTSDLTLVVEDTITWSTNGIVTDNGGTFTNNTGDGVSDLAGGTALTIPSTAQLYANTDRTLTSNLIVTGTMTHSNNGTTAAGQLYEIVYVVQGDLTVDGAVNLNSRGFEMDEGTGAGSLVGSHGGGGGHGGDGGQSGDSSGLEAGSEGSAYGSNTVPVTIGSGGGYDASILAGSGGGAAKFTVTGATSISGSFTADGEDASSGARENGGGSGGSVYIITGSLAGAGTVTALGGAGYDNGSNEGGGGGGGRIALYYSTDTSSFTPTVTGGAGGDAYSEAGDIGTVYEEVTNTAPTVATVTASQATDGSGEVTITFILDDADDDITLRAAIAVSDDGGTDLYAHDPTLSTEDADTTASYGDDPGIDNDAATYQVGISAGPAYVNANAGANTVSIVWNSKTDMASTSVSNAKVQITPSDGTSAGSTDISADFTLDNVAPSAPTLSYTTPTASYSTSISGTGAENGTNVYVNGVDSGVDAADSAFSVVVYPVQGVTTTYNITLVDSYGNVSVAAAASIERFGASSSGGGGGETPPPPAPEEEILEDEEEFGEDDFAMGGEAEPEDGGEDEEAEPDDGGEDEEAEPDDGGEDEEAEPDDGEEEEEEEEDVPFVGLPFEITPKRARVFAFFRDRGLFGALSEYGFPRRLLRVLREDRGPAYDADGDGATDYEELLVGSDPYVAYSEPEDPFDEEIFDDLDEGILDLLDDGLDGDLDGLSDEVELGLGLDPDVADSDGDGLLDGEEILLYQSDPTEAGELPEGLHITNITNDDQVPAGQQVLTGYGEEKSTILIYDLTGDEPVLIAEVKADDNGHFIAVTDRLEAGEHILIAVDDKGRDISSLVILNVAEFLGIQTPGHDPLVLNDGDRVTMAQIGLIPAVSQALEANLMMVITWHSSIFSQTIIADANTEIGESIIITPTQPLETGKHEVTWYAVDPVNNLRSGPGQIAFTVVPSAFSITQIGSGQPIYLWTGIVLIVMFFVGLKVVRVRKS
ncbi:hypothetical protein HOH67_00395, partial [Candidatus Peregrinibacteria bacterium]|nr:hypothetical protein [Candidatus Peregrinibacteria bacterium]